jgi:hypothetical protein
MPNSKDYPPLGNYGVELEGPGHDNGDWPSHCVIPFHHIRFGTAENTWSDVKTNRLNALDGLIASLNNGQRASDISEKAKHFYAREANEETWRNPLECMILESLTGKCEANSTIDPEIGRIGPEVYPFSHTTAR